MTDGNQVTLQAYEDGWERYIAGTPAVPLGCHGPWLPEAMARRPYGSTILEIGSGPGHDAARMEALGARVERTDATAGFVTHLQAQGHPARQLNILTDEPGGPYGMIYAFAVFQHFEEYQVNLALKRCEDALMPGGVLAVSFRRGGSTPEWHERKGLAPRMFWYWEPGLLWHTVERTGLRMAALHQDTAVSQDADQTVKTWLLVTAVKPSGSACPPPATTRFPASPAADSPTRCGPASCR